MFENISYVFPSLVSLYIKFLRLKKKIRSMSLGQKKDNFKYQQILRPKKCLNEKKISSKIDVQHSFKKKEK